MREVEFTRYDDGTCGDQSTGLYWLANVECFGVKDDLGEAIAACNSLSDGICGLTDGSRPGDWRLPTKTELDNLGRNELLGGMRHYWTENGERHLVCPYGGCDNSSYGSPAVIDSPGYVWCVRIISKADIMKRKNNEKLQPPQ